MRLPKIPLFTMLDKVLGKRFVHVETAYIDEHFSKLVEHAKKYRLKCYCITPVDYDFAKVEFGVNMSKREFSEILRKRYLELKKFDADLQLHVHVAILPEMLTKDRKRKKIHDAYNFFVEQLGIRPTEIVFGWFIGDEELREIAKELNLEVIDEHFHIYERWLK